MTRASLREYAAVQRERYQHATRAEKHQLLDELVTVTGMHRKAAIRLLRRGPGPRRSPPALAARGATAPTSPRRPKSCGRPAAGSVPTGCIRSWPNSSIGSLRCGELTVAAAVEKLSGRRVARPSRGCWRPPARSSRRAGPPPPSPAPGSHEIPIRTFTEWDDARPGFCEVDLVAHCGSSTQGFYLCTLCAVDIATTWVELEAVWGKGQQRVGSAIHYVRERLPVPLVGLDSDNGSEFINHRLYDWCQREGITFTRSRAYKKNDGAHVEQKNGAVVRRLVGYDRFASRPAFAQLRASIGSPACT